MWSYDKVLWCVACGAKIFYKQNKNDYAKGADSVHIVIENKDNFSLWLGESKFYKDIQKAIDEAIKSIIELLKDDKLKKEQSIITSIGDLDELEELKNNQELLKNIKNKLETQRSLDEIKQILHIPIFLLYECNLTKKHNEFSDIYKNELSQNSKQILKIIYEKLKKASENIPHIDKIFFHIILFPVPNKEIIIEKVKQKAKAFND
nr:DUF1837 domain-containing protein [Campylobacter mucosalis]